MSPFTSVQRDVRESQIHRDALLGQPAEFFLTHYGVQPDPMERLYLVEDMIQKLGTLQIFANDVYVVRVRNMSPFIQLNIARHDGQPCTSWRDLQQIKNELVGAEYEGVELFPAESRLVDTSNEYHLWVHSDRKYRFPMGFWRRMVLDGPLVYRKGDECVQLTADNVASAQSAKAVS
jgi:hypothetical protein